MIKTLNGDIIQIFANDGSEIIMVKDYLGRTVFEKVKPVTITGTLPLTVLANGKALKDYKIYGETVQDGAPTPENPVEVIGLGVRTESGEPTGYKLPLKVTAGGVTTDYSVYIGDSQLMRIPNTEYADYVDYEKGKIVRQIKTLVLTGEETWYFYVRSFYTGANFNTNYLIDDSSILIISDHYKGRKQVKNIYSFDTGNIYEIAFSNSSDAVTTRRLFIKHGVLTNLSDFKTFLSDQYAAGTPVTVWYVLETPIEEDPPVPFPEIALPKGEATIDIEGELKPHAELTGYIQEAPPRVYGWHVDPSISDPANAITYLGDAVGKTPAAMGSETFSYGDWSDAFFMPKPCMLRSDGTVDYYLDPNDYTKKADGTASDVANASFDGNAMMEWPLIWWKYEAGETEGEGYFYVANRKVDDSFNCWCNYNCDDKIVSHFYTAIYNGTGTSKMRSISGVALTHANGNGNATAAREITRATANNTTDKTEWYIDVWADRMLINGLLILMGKSLNSQAVFGRGLDTGSQTAKEAYITGSLNDKGLFYGVTANGNSGVKVFGMENWWGCVWRRTAGLIGLSNGNTAYKLTYGTADGTTADSYNTNGNGYLVDTTARPANGYSKTAKFGKFGYLPLTTGGSSTTYYSDYWYTNNSALTFAHVGGAAYNGVLAGCSYFSLTDAPSYAHWNVSSSLSFKPLV